MAKDQIAPSSCAMLVVGGSAGSIEVLLRFLPGIRNNLQFPVLIVLHRKAAGSDLADLLGSRCSLPVREIGDKESIEPGTVYVAPGDYHVLIEKTPVFALDYSEKVNYSRPSIDVAFESATAIYGASLVCLLLSGANADGAEGLRLAKANGARVAVQDPATADAPEMPSQGRLRAGVDLLLRPEEIAGFINAL